MKSFKEMPQFGGMPKRDLHRLTQGHILVERVLVAGYRREGLRLVAYHNGLHGVVYDRGGLKTAQEFAEAFEDCARATPTFWDADRHEAIVAVSELDEKLAEELADLWAYGLLGEVTTEVCRHRGFALEFAVRPGCRLLRIRKLDGKYPTVPWEERFLDHGTLLAHAFLSATMQPGISLPKDPLLLLKAVQRIEPAFTIHALLGLAALEEGCRARGVDVGLQPGWLEEAKAFVLSVSVEPRGAISD